MNSLKERELMKLVSLGSQIKFYRGKSTQEQFAKELKISKSKLSSFENNKQLPTTDEFCSICQTLNLSADKLLGLPENLEFPSKRRRQLGTKLLSLRESRKLSQSQFANLIGVSESTLSKYERNNRTPPLNRLRSICEQFNISADYLLNTK